MSKGVRLLIVSGAVAAASAVAHSAAVSGTVTNKTTDKPSAGDKVVLVDVSAGMADAATAVTDKDGKYTLQTPGAGAFLIRVDHQGGTYFIAAPQDSTPANITVYDVAAKVDGVGIDADMMLIEATGSTLNVRERYLVRNSSSPPRTQFSQNGFEIVLPEGAVLEEAAATRPGGLGTRTHLAPLPQKGHYAFNVPIQPDQGEKETLFEVQYRFAYDGKHTFAIRPLMPADNFVVYTAKGIEFSAKDGAPFRATQEDPRVETHVVKGVHPGDVIAFNVSGQGQMPQDQGAAPTQKPSSGPLGKPGGGIGEPIGSPDPLSGSKTWLLGGLAVVLAGVAFFVVRRRSAMAGPVASEPAVRASATIDELPRAAVPQQRTAAGGGPSGGQGVLIESLKEELFSLEQDKVSGKISSSEYADAKSGLEAMLKRVLKANS
ncbi:hypothetical protein [Occallatibacter savannae]|uniref:hypothetical protein n=1 Tax=Occallatibacter savannae TaxID=1002691 RepID=UPI000D699B5E|nr:hypothetical protein [Occallatibacter savannae]